jgi:excisionase family DNA binding protein
MSDTNTDPITVTVAETRKVSGLGTTTIYHLIKHKKLKTIRVGRRRLVDYASLKALLTSSAA